MRAVFKYWCNKSRWVFWKKYGVFSTESKIFKLSNYDLNILFPYGLSIDDYEIDKLVQDMDIFKNKFSEFSENYKDEKQNFKKLLDVLLEEGIFPTYSFPRNVIGFYIEDSTGNKIIEKPERAIDISLSEYAPGRIVVVNKKIL